MQLPRRRMPQRPELLSLAFAIVLVSLIGLLAYRTWVDFGRSSEQVEISRQIVDGANALLSSVRDAETGQRGFLLTGRDQYLEPYRQAITEVPNTVEKLTNITAARRPDQAERLNRLRPLVKDKLDELGETILVRRSEGPEAAFAIVMTDRGNAIMDQIRAVCTEIQSVANRHMTQFSAEAHSNANRLGIVSSVGSVALLILLFLATATIERGTQRHEQLIESLDQKEMQLRESRDLLYTTLNSIGDAVISTNAAGRITFVNPVTRSILRQTEASLVGKNLDENFKIINEYTRAAVQSPVEKVLREGAIVGMANHTVLLCPDGREVPIDDSAAPIRGAAGDLQGTVLVFRDITERRRAEQASRLLSSIVESSDDAIISKDLNGIVTSWNAGAERVFGYTAREMIGKPIATIAAPDRLDEMPAILERIRNGDRVDHYETVRKTKDGTLINIALTVSPVRDASGRIVGASKIARDITERKRADERLQATEQEAREAREWLSATLSSIGDAVIATDDAGKVTLLNPVAARLTGWAQEDAAGRPLDEVFDISNEETGAKVENPVSKVLREARIVGLANHTQLTARDGRVIPIDDSAAPIRGANDKLQGSVLVFRDITERRRAEQITQLLSSIVESSDDAVISKDLNGVVTSWNASAERIFGYTANEMIGKPINTIAAPDRLEEMPAILERIRNGDKVEHHETIRKTKNGALIDISLTVSPVRDASGRIVGASKIARDITEKKRAEERLRAKEQEAREARELLSATLSSIGDGVIATDNAGTVTLLNPVAASLTGWAQEDAKGRALDEVFDISNEETGAKVESPVRKVLREGHIANHTRLTAKNGRVVPIDDSAAQIHDADGVAGVVMVFRDVTERRKAEQELTRLKDQLDHEVAGLRSLHQFGTRLVQAVDMHSLLNEVLAAAETITDAEMGNVQLIDRSTGRLHIKAQHRFSDEFLNFFSHVREDEAAVCGAAFARRQRVLVDDVETSPIFAGTPALDVLRREGIRAVQSTPIMGRDGVLVGMLSTHFKARHQFSERDLRLLDLLVRQAADLIEKVRAEEDLRVTNTALVRANQDLNQFAFAASHDLQEPLRMITAYSQLLVQGYRGQPDGEASTCVQFISEGTKRMHELLADLLAYTQLTGDSQALEQVDLNHIFQTAVQNCQAAIEETGGSVTSDPLPTIHGHEPQFVQLLQNLISNALKYRSQRPPQIHVSAVSQRGMWKFGVTDNGIGIAAEHHKQIFGVFKRLHGRSIPGTGIGLAICLRVVERYGGEIWVESEVDQGATFYFTLPAIALGPAV